MKPIGLMADDVGQFTPFGIGLVATQQLGRAPQTGQRVAYFMGKLPHHAAGKRLAIVPQAILLCPPAQTGVVQFQQGAAVGECGDLNVQPLHATGLLPFDILGRQRPLLHRSPFDQSAEAARPQFTRERLAHLAASGAQQILGGRIDKTNAAPCIQAHHRGLQVLHPVGQGNIVIGWRL